MIQKEKIKLLIAILFIPLLCISIFASYGLYGFYQSKAKDKIVLAGITKRTGLPPNWLAIREYVYCDLLKPGTPKDEVDKGLSMIGPYYIPGDEKDTEQEIEFIDSPTHENLSPLMIIYNHDWKVTDSGAGGETNFGPRAHCEIKGDNGQTTLTPKNK